MTVFSKPTPKARPPDIFARAIAQGEQFLTRHKLKLGLPSYHNQTVPALRRRCGDDAKMFARVNKLIIRRAKDVPKNKLTLFLGSNIPRLLLACPEIKRFIEALDPLTQQLGRVRGPRRVRIYPGTAWPRRLITKNK